MIYWNIFKYKGVYIYYIYNIYIYIYIPYVYIYKYILQSISAESEWSELLPFFHSVCTSIFWYHMDNLKVTSLDTLFKIDTFRKEKKKSSLASICFERYYSNNFKWACLWLLNQIMLHSIAFLSPFFRFMCRYYRK